MTLAGVKQGRCGYCGWPCDGAACACHADLSVDAPVDEYAIALQSGADLSTGLHLFVGRAYAPRMLEAAEDAVSAARERAS